MLRQNEDDINWELVEYPLEVYFPLEREKFILARITLTKLNNAISSDLDLVQKKTKKIVRHLGHYQYSLEGREAFENALLKLTSFLSPQ